MPRKKPDDAPSIDLTQSDAPEAPRPRWGFGHLPDPPSEKDYNVGMLLGGTPNALPGEVDLTRFVDVVYDQGATSSCVAHAAVGAIETRLAMQGRRARLSRSEPYKVARALARKDSAAPLVDEGCYPRFLMKGMRDVGVNLDEVSPFDPDTIDKELAWGELSKASAHKISAWYRIDQEGESRLQQIAHALAKGYVVIFGAIVGQAFMDADPSTVLEPELKEPLGGHMLGIYAYSGVGSARRFRIRNSYGPKWGDGGFAWAHSSFITHPTSTDFYVITV